MKRGAVFAAVASIAAACGGPDENSACFWSSGQMKSELTIKTGIYGQAVIITSSDPRCPSGSSEELEVSIRHHAEPTSAQVAMITSNHGFFQVELEPGDYDACPDGADVCAHVTLAAGDQHYLGAKGGVGPYGGAGFEFE